MKKSLFCDFRYMYDTCAVEHRNISSWSCLDYIFFTETLKEFRHAVIENEDIQGQINKLRGEVESFASQFPMPGLEER